MSVFFINNAGATTSAAMTADEAADLKGDILGDRNEDNGTTSEEAQAALAKFWANVTEEIKTIGTMDLKQQVLPLARIKKIMKLDEDVKMISAEAPLLFAKAAEIFVHELTLRSWIHTEDNKRRTLQRNDIAMAITKFDQFDFLIDIVPRDDIKPMGKSMKEEGVVRTGSTDQVHYYLQLAQQHHASLQQGTTPTATVATSAATQPQNSIIVQPSQVQTLQVNPIDQSVSSAAASASNAQPILIQSGAPTATSPTQQAQTGNIQIVHQIMTPSGEIQQIPIQLSPQQMQLIRMQLQSNSNQPLIIQAAAPIQTQPQIIQVAQQGAQGQQVFLTTQSNGSTESE